MVGCEKTVTLYRKNSGWVGVKIVGVSVTGAQSRVTTDSRDKTGKHRIEQGARHEKSATIIIPSEAIPADLAVALGDIVVLGEGPAQLSSPSQPAKEGLPYVLVQEISDRRGDRILPHLKLKGC